MLIVAPMEANAFGKHSPGQCGEILLLTIFQSAGTNSVHKDDSLYGVR